jgi:hypothetical protein
VVRRAMRAFFPYAGPAAILSSPPGIKAGVYSICSWSICCKLVGGSGLLGKSSPPPDWPARQLFLLPKLCIMHQSGAVACSLCTESYRNTRGVWLGGWPSIPICKAVTAWIGPVGDMWPFVLPDYKIPACAAAASVSLL